MGACAHYQGISPRLLAALIAEPRLALAVLALGSPTDEMLHAEALARAARLPPERREETLRQFHVFMKLKGPDFFPAEHRRQEQGLKDLGERGFTRADLQVDVDIDKQWRRLEDALDRLSEPLGFAIVGGTEVGEDLGYGPLRYFTPDHTQRIAMRLDHVAPSLSDSAEFEYDDAALETVRVSYRLAAEFGFGMLLHFA
jgi:uncharacterized protein DUF1877